MKMTWIFLKPGGHAKMTSCSSLQENLLCEVHSDALGRHFGHDKTFQLLEA